MRIMSGSATDETRPSYSVHEAVCELEFLLTRIDRNQSMIELHVPHRHELVQVGDEAAGTRIPEVRDVVHVRR